MPEPDAEQLLKMLDLQLAQKRAEHARGRRPNRTNRNAVRVGALLCVLTALLGALFLLHFMIGELRSQATVPRPMEASAR